MALVGKQHEHERRHLAGNMTWERGRARQHARCNPEIILDTYWTESRRFGEGRHDCVDCCVEANLKVKRPPPDPRIPE